MFLTCVLSCFVLVEIPVVVTARIYAVVVDVLAVDIMYICIMFLCCCC